MNFLSFPSIESFHNVVNAVEAYPHIAPVPVNYRGKIKLHGTNAAVRIHNGEVSAQSRTSIITPENDNMGFAKWVVSIADYWQHIRAVGGNSPNNESVTVFGEWCGPGILKGTAIQQIPHKIFAVFAIMIGETLETSVMVTEPAEIEKLISIVTSDDMPRFARPADVHVLPWDGEIVYTADFSNRTGLQTTVDALNKVVERVEPCDPWVKATFNVEGIGEGVVYYPGAGERVTRKQFSDLAFKAKGEKHKVVKTKESVQIDPEIAKSVEEFVTMFVTEPRLEQGVTAVGGSLEMKNIGPFLKWISQDVQKESKVELEVANLEWSDVQKSVQTLARNYFIKKSKTV